MATIAIIDHSFHKKTKSSRFFTDFLQERGHRLSYYWDESWQGGAPVFLDNSICKHDIIICFQILPTYVKKLASHHPNIIFVPMLDTYGFTAHRGLNFGPYFAALHGIKIINFSKILHYYCQGIGLYSRYFQYWLPHIIDEPPLSTGLHGFFWCRRPSQINWHTVKALIGDTVFDSFYLRLIPDPGEKITDIPTPEEQKRHNMTISYEWFTDKEEYEALLKKTNVFFVPRLEEGIGLAMLDSFRRGHCIVSPDHGTMNEYIKNGYNGILYDYTDPQTINILDLPSIQKNILHDAEQGYLHWEKSLSQLEEYILTPSEKYYAQLKLRTPFPPDSFIRYISQIPYIRDVANKLKKYIKNKQ